MPTPPTGDIACAASPMHSRPGRYHCAQPVDLTVSSLTSSQLAQLAARGRAATARPRRWRRGTPSSPCALHLVEPRPSGSRRRTASSRRGRASPACWPASMRPSVSSPSLGAPRQPHPQHVHRRAEVLDREPGALAHHRVAAVGADDEVGADRRASPSGVVARTPTTRPPSSIRSVDLRPHAQIGTSDSAGRARRGNRGSPTAASAR